MVFDHVEFIHTCQIQFELAHTRDKKRIGLCFPGVFGKSYDIIIPDIQENMIAKGTKFVAKFGNLG